MLLARMSVAGQLIAMPCASLMGLFVCIAAASPPSNRTSLPAESLHPTPSCSIQMCSGTVMLQMSTQTGRYVTNHSTHSTKVAGASLTRVNSSVIRGPGDDRLKLQSLSKTKANRSVTPSHMSVHSFPRKASLIGVSTASCIESLREFAAMLHRKREDDAGMSIFVAISVIIFGCCLVIGIIAPTMHEEKAQILGHAQQNQQIRRRSLAPEHHRDIGMPRLSMPSQHLASAKKASRSMRKQNAFNAGSAQQKLVSLNTSPDLNYIPRLNLPTVHEPHHGVHIPRLNLPTPQSASANIDSTRVDLPHSHASVTYPFSVLEPTHRTTASRLPIGSRTSVISAASAISTSSQGMDLAMPAPEPEQYMMTARPPPEYLMSARAASASLTSRPHSLDFVQPAPTDMDAPEYLMTARAGSRLSCRTPSPFRGSSSFHASEHHAPPFSLGPAAASATAEHPQVHQNLSAAAMEAQRKFLQAAATIQHQDSPRGMTKTASQAGLKGKGVQGLVQFYNTPRPDHV